ncbi:HAD family hydrolase [Vibrio japonicus]|uniref:HAD hydrolase-like protein n=1 Tax=Vibrio japonicus TaxID=1824638 RepID=A0ABY5LPU1_9VIBR|nr:HAD hydrolase-like protein [Vibrio japonicus]UUM32955.1 HAD hydrolase-like protein [Vibrio japonicus]
MSYVPLNINHIKAIVFDLDNTLVTSDMDFAWLREQLGCPLSSDLLSYVDDIECSEERARAHDVILNHELEDARTSHPMPGCLSILEFIHSNHFLTAVITRNCAEATDQKIAHNRLNIPRVITREHFPPKPSPDALIALAQEWQLQCHQVLYVGDFLYDLQAAFNAKMPSCLVTHGKEVAFSEQASLVVDHLHDLEDFISRHLIHA